jgi:hypothetical protein
VAWFPALAPGKILQFHVISPAMVGIFNSDLLFVMVKYLLGYVEIGRGGRDKVVMALLRETGVLAHFLFYIQVGTHSTYGQISS